MIETKTGLVKRILSERPGLIEIEVDCEGLLSKAVVYEYMTGSVEPGNRVLLNATATTLGLGSGGYDMVMVNLDNPKASMTGKGHIMKMRYTPWQCRVLSVEEESSPYHQVMKEVDDLEQIPVLVGTLHSMLAPLCACLADRGLRTAYVMTDGASLPIYWSRTVHDLKQKGLLLGTVTSGNAFGGDLEAVNIFSGLLAAKAILKPDIIIVAMGPGIVGTGTALGFTGVEQGITLNAVDSLHGTPIGIPRISFSDPRPRHYGISHHTMTVLSKVCKASVTVPLPMLGDERQERIRQQLDEAELADIHNLVYRDGSHVEEMLAKYGLKTTTMGRNLREDYEFFLALGAAAAVASELVPN